MLLVAGLGILSVLSVALAQTSLTITYGEPWKELIEPAIAAFEQATGIQVAANVVPYGVDMVEKVSLDLAAGTATDIFMVDSFMIPSYAEAGYLYPLDGYLAAWPDWDQYFPGMQEIVAFGGQHYGVMIDTDVRMLWYWKPVFAEAGISIPWEPRDWTDVLATAIIIKERCPEVDAPLFIPRCAPRAEPPGVLRVEAGIWRGSAKGGAG
jgi:multiple sugar transport system substrate-binding protein